jgi:hypothetical protein
MDFGLRVYEKNFGRGILGGALRMDSETLRRRDGWGNGREVSWIRGNEGGLCGPAIRLRIQLALARVGERAKNGAGVVVADLTQVHGDGEQEDEKEKVDAKQ